MVRHAQVKQPYSVSNFPQKLEVNNVSEEGMSKVQDGLALASAAKQPSGYYKGNFLRANKNETVVKTQTIRKQNNLIADVYF